MTDAPGAVPVSLPQQQPQYPPSIQQTVIVHAPPQSQALPALVNALCLPGLGQLIQGRFIAAVCWWVLYLFAGLSLFIGVGIIVLPLCWLACVLDAATYDPNARRGGWEFFIIGAMAAVVGVVLLVGGGLVAVGYNKVETSAAAKRAAERSPAPEIVLPTESSPHDAERTPTTPPSYRPPPADSPKLRTWTSNDGKFSTEATFKSMGGGSVKLRKADGSEISVTLERLSDDDRQWIENYRRSR